MKKLLTILLLVPFLFYAQDTTSVEVCTHNQTHLQRYTVTSGPNQYTWSVAGGTIESGHGTNSIVVNWLNVPYSMYLIQVSVVSNAGCPGNTVQLWVDIDECSYDGIYVPNSFTPQNPDGINDVFQPIGNNIEELHMHIFNRWGELIHEIYTIDGYWDGTYKNIPCQQDVYVWFLKYRFIGNNFFEEIRGHVTLVR
jgi:gliding motility-associated-like protein